MLHRALAMARRARDSFPLTWLGFLVAVGSAWATFYFGFERIDLLLLVAGIVGMALVATTMLLVSIVALIVYLQLRSRTTEETLQLECGYARRTGFSVKSPWFVPFVQVGWSWLDPKVHLHIARQGLTLVEEVAPVERCLRSSIRRRVEVADSFGLNRIRFEVAEARPLRFVPSIGNLRQVHVIRSMAEGDQLSHPDGPPHGERVDMRHYVPGDPIRFILWKVFAKSREIVVRTPERALGPVRQTVAYVVRGPQDEPAAGAARVAMDAGAFGGDWVVGCDGDDVAAQTPGEALQLLAKGGEVGVDQGGLGLDPFLRRQAPGSLGRALVFVPGKPGPWLDRVAAAVAKGRMAQVEFLVCTDGVRTGTEEGWLRRLRRDDPRLDPRKGVGPVTAEELAEVCRTLGGLRVRVTVLDRLTGRVYTEAHQRALLERGAA